MSEAGSQKPLKPLTLLVEEYSKRTARSGMTIVKITGREEGAKSPDKKTRAVFFEDKADAFAQDFEARAREAGFEPDIFQCRVVLQGGWRKENDWTDKDGNVRQGGWEFHVRGDFQIG